MELVNGIGKSSPKERARKSALPTPPRRGASRRGIRVRIGGENPPASKTAPDSECRGLGVRKWVG